MKKFIGSLFVLSLALAALVSKESEASAFVVPSYGSGYGSSSSIGYANPLTVRVTVSYPQNYYGGYSGFGASCSYGCGAYRPVPYYPYAGYGGGYGYGGYGGSHGYGYGGGGGWGFGFRIGRFSFRFASWGGGYKKKHRHGHGHHGHYAKHWSRYNGMYY
jgi:hypothetical protein